MKLLIVDDHPVVREGLAALLRQSGTATVVLEASDAGEALGTLGDHRDVDAVLMDLALPGMDGLSAIKQLALRWPELPVIVLSSSEDPDVVRQALALGASGYVPKSANPRTLLAAIGLVLSGEIYVPPLILKRTQGAPISQHGEPERGSLRLTARQIDVLRMLSEGHSNKAIAIALDLSEKTVKAHITALFRVLNVVNRTQAASAWRRASLS